MHIHEYQAKSLLKKYGVAIQEGILANTPEKAIIAAEQLTQQYNTKCYVIKAQIHAGGRGKGGGVKLAHNINEVKSLSHQILGMQLCTPQTGPQGKKVHKVLIAEDVYCPGEVESKEYYLSILLDRANSCDVIMASTEGGMDIEEVAEKMPEKIIREWIDPTIGLQTFQAKKIALALGLSGKAFKEMIYFITKFYQAYRGIEATLIEINPVLKTSNNTILAVDAKIDIDDNALYRHPDLAVLRDTLEEEPLEVEASQFNLNYIKLDGNVGCMVNGAGLAMATMDIIQLAGGLPANFLDVGGNANAQTVENGFKIILKDKRVKIILINIFGGIVRCDRVALGIIEAYKNIGTIDIPIVIRLQGTNAEEAQHIIQNNKLKVSSVVLLQDAADQIQKILE